jgi:hypothetical protein
MSDVGKYKGDLHGIEIESSDGEDYEEEARPLKNVTNNSSGKVNGTGGKGLVQKPAKSAGGLFSSLKGLVGAKVLTTEMIEPVMEKMQDHLIGNLKKYILS